MIDSKSMAKVIGYITVQLNSLSLSELTFPLLTFNLDLNYSSF